MCSKVIKTGVIGNWGAKGDRSEVLSYFTCHCLRNVMCDEVPSANLAGERNFVSTENVGTRDDDSALMRGPQTGFAHFLLKCQWRNSPAMTVCQIRTVPKHIQSFKAADAGEIQDFDRVGSCELPFCGSDGNRQVMPTAVVQDCSLRVETSEETHDCAAGAEAYVSFPTEVRWGVKLYRALRQCRQRSSFAPTL